MLINKEDMVEVSQPPQSNLCTLACISMVSGVPIETLIKQAGIQDISNYIGTYLRDAVKLLVLNNLYPKLSTNSVMFYGSVYIATVPSLTKRAGLHSIVVDMREDDIVVYDPNRINYPDDNYSDFDVNKLPATEIIQILDAFNLPHNV